MYDGCVALDPIRTTVAMMQGMSIKRGESTGNKARALSSLRPASAHAVGAGGVTRVPSTACVGQQTRPRWRLDEALSTSARLDGMLESGWQSTADSHELSINGNGVIASKELRQRNELLALSQAHLEAQLRIALQYLREATVQIDVLTAQKEAAELLARRAEVATASLRAALEEAEMGGRVEANLRVVEPVAAATSTAKGIAEEGEAEGLSQGAEASMSSLRDALEQAHAVSEDSSKVRVPEVACSAAGAAPLHACPVHSPKCNLPARVRRPHHNFRACLAQSSHLQWLVVSSDPVLAPPCQLVPPRAWAPLRMAWAPLRMAWAPLRMAWATPVWTLASVRT